MSEKRTYASIEAALDEFAWWPRGNRSVVVERVRALDWSEIYTPAGGGYIGVKVQGEPVIFRVHSGYTGGVKDNNGRRHWEALPVNSIRDGNGEQRKRREGPPCPICNTITALNLVCNAGC